MANFYTEQGEMRKGSDLNDKPLFKKISTGKAYEKTQSRDYIY